MEFKQIPEHLTTLAKESDAVFQRITGADWASPYPGSSGWVRSEVLAHLIDSAVNNHQRFARALAADELRFPGYQQNDMVRVHKPRNAPTVLLTEVWVSLNRYIAHLLRQVPEQKRSTMCYIGDNPGMTLESLALDYVAHLEHHLRQIAGPAALPYSGLPYPA
jgi:hypothetical protein